MTTLWRWIFGLNLWGGMERSMCVALPVELCFCCLVVVGLSPLPVIVEMKVYRDSLLKM